MIEPITKALTVAGTTLTFGSFSIKGVLGFNISILYKGEQTLYETERQNFSFQTATTDVVEYQISSGDRFSMKDTAKEYTLEVSRTIDDLSGWTELHCDYISGKEF